MSPIAKRVSFLKYGYKKRHEEVTAIDEILIYSINKPKPEYLVVLKILDSVKEEKPKMMKTDW